MTAQPNDVWGDDFLAIAEGVGVVRHPDTDQVAFLTMPGDLEDLVLALELATWAERSPDAPVPLVPMDFDICGGCGVLAEDVCGHRSAPLCADCGWEHCRDCRDEQTRWDR
jgi:hypothetical protein